MTTITLTKENAKEASVIINKLHPEWGTKRFTYDANGYHSFGVGCNSSVLFESDFQFWQVVSFK